jgi:hypothetical protein
MNINEPIPTKGKHNPPWRYKMREKQELHASPWCYYLSSLLWMSFLETLLPSTS